MFDDPGAGGCHGHLAALPLSLHGICDSVPHTAVRTRLAPEVADPGRELAGTLETTRLTSARKPGLAVVCSRASDHTRCLSLRPVPWLHRELPCLEEHFKFQTRRLVL